MDPIKFIFLDIDGVLNSDIYMSSDEYFAECNSLGIDPVGRNVIDKAHYLHIDPSAVKLVNILVERSGAKVILSSTWRCKYSLTELNIMFQKRGATFQIDGVTPAKMSWRPRGHDIRSFFNEFYKKSITPEAFVIIDDIDEFSLYPSHLVQTSEETGLTQEDVTKALKILKVEDETD